MMVMLIWCNMLVTELLLLVFSILDFINTTNGHQFTMSNDKKELAISGQTETGKELSNPLMAGSLPKTTLPTQLVLNVVFAVQLLLNAAKMKSSHKSKIAELESRVEKLEEENMSLTNELKSFNSKVESPAVKETVRDQEKSSKQERKIADINADAEVITTANIIVDEISTAGGELNAADEEPVSAAPTNITTSQPSEATKTTVDITTAPKAKGIVFLDVEESTTRTTSSKSHVKDKGKAKIEAEWNGDMQDNIDWNEVVEQVQSSKSDVVRKYQALKRKPVSVAQARKNMMIYLKNTAGFKMEFFKGMSYEEIIPLFEEEYNKVQTLFKEGPEMDAEKIKAPRKEDLEVLWKIVKDRFNNSQPKEVLDVFLWHTLKMFNEVRLQVDYEVEMAYDLLRLGRIVGKYRHLQLSFQLNAAGVGLREVHKAVHDNLVRANSKYKQDADQKRRHVDFEAGDFVWAVLTKNRFPVGEYNKLLAKKISPLEIVEKINSNAYRLKLPSHIRCSDVFNVKYLLPYHGDSSDDDLVVNLRVNFVYPGGMMQAQKRELAGLPEMGPTCHVIADMETTSSATSASRTHLLMWQLSWQGDNVRDWEFKCDQFFSVDNTPEMEKVKIVYAHLDDKALFWHKQFVKIHRDNIGWEMYNTVIFKFGLVFEDPMAALKNNKYEKSAKEYQDVFDTLLCRVEIRQEHVMSLYLDGLST
uniref:Putative reverse transcriptase domain-containing protein n=1 Tax=Tanacetum cinerariifolium TaxID=118510 RepID=A0A6L2MU79_TANCI|nr:putative reverse transcriptase domain-containing protein [Tanacetum cinerariifolium]